MAFLKSYIKTNFEITKGTKIEKTDDFKIVFGGYMDKGRQPYLFGKKIRCVRANDGSESRSSTGVVDSNQRGAGNTC